MYKVVFGTTGAIVGGVIGFLIALFGIALLLPRYGMLYGAHGLFGVPFGAIVGCLFGVKVTDRIVAKLSVIDRRLPILLVLFLLSIATIWIVMECFGGW